VKLENGQRIAAPVVVSNADARQTALELTGAEHFPTRYVSRLRSAKPSISAFVVYAATTLDLNRADLGHETFLYPSADHEAAHASGRRGEPDWLSLTAPTRVDPSLAPPGEHLLVLTTLVDASAEASWSDAKERWMDTMLARAERRLPGLRASLRFAEAGTPRTMERYTRNENGAIYGFDVTPGQVGPGRVDNRTPLPGLYLAGHWTRPGGGVAGVVRSGMRTAALVSHASTAR
jgi:prolycopene isomerase